MFQVHKTLLVLSLMNLVTGCGPLVVEQQINYVTLPEIYQHCLTEPAPPVEHQTQAAWGRYILDMKRYGNDCEAKVKGASEWSKQHQTPPSPKNNPPEQEHWWKIW